MRQASPTAQPRTENSRRPSSRTRASSSPGRPPDGTPIDSDAAVTRALAAVPDGVPPTALAADPQRMVDDGLPMDHAEPFDVSPSRCQALANKVNARVRE